MTSIDILNLVELINRKVLPFMAFVQLSADQQQRQLCFKMDRLDERV